MKKFKSYINESARSDRFEQDIAQELKRMGFDASRPVLVKRAHLYEDV